MANHRVLVLPVLSCLLLPLPAQEGPPSPPEQLQKLQRLVGSWRGSGTAAMQPGVTTNWTCEATYRWALGNFWLQCDTSIAFEGGETPMRFREYMGFDTEARHFVNVVVSNTGEVTLAPVAFVGDDKLVLAMARLQDGTPLAERSVTTIGKDAIDFTITFVAGDAPAVEGVQGKLQRVPQAAPTPLEKTAAFAPMAPEMARLGRMGGDYAVQGQMVMVPGSPPVKIQGRDAARPLFGGSILQVVTKGTAEGMPGEYEATVFYGWDAAEQCYRGVMVSNMGEVGQTRARFVGDDKFVAVWAGMMMGQPTANHTLMQLQDGRPQSLVSHCISGDGKPYECMRASYQPAK